MQQSDILCDGNKKCVLAITAIRMRKCPLFVMIFGEYVKLFIAY